MNHEYPLDRVDRLVACVEAVSDLMIPDATLHGVNRDHLAMLMSFLTDELKEACARLRPAAH